MTTIDLRSDTVTKPNDAMRKAMAEAEVGDDVWGEDPTVIALQERTADVLGKEAALFLPSGTMANQAALLSYTRPGDEVLIGWGSHCTNFEAGGAGALAGIQAREIGVNGQFKASDVQAALQPANVHLPPTTLVWIENSHNRAGGLVYDPAEIERIAEVCRKNALPLHTDGARLFNAAAAAGVPAKTLLAPVNSTSICLSKGLGCPLGSMLAGDAGFIARAYRYRKMLGGGMRQAGIVAAAGLYALEHNIARLEDDHKNARLLAEAWSTVDGVILDAKTVQTNIVIFDLADDGPDAEAIINACAKKGLLFSQFGPRRIRAVTHLDVDREACERGATILADVIRAQRTQ